MSTQTVKPSLEGAALARRVDALFKAMATDFLLREQFITDPAQVLCEYTHGKDLPQQTASVTNQLLYAVMANRGLLGWLRGYAMKHHQYPPPGQKFISDFGRAVVQHRSHHVVLALLRSSAEPEGRITFDPAMLPIIFTIFARGIGGVFAAGTEMSTGTDFGTERSGWEGTGRTAEARHLRRRRWRWYAGTDFGTERQRH